MIKSKILPAAKLWSDVLSDGTRLWFKDGLIHRDDGPAMIKRDGTEVWYDNGNIHREDGPAIEHANGEVEYYINGVKLTEEPV